MNMFSNNTTAVVEKLDKIKVVPVLVLENVDEGLKLCEVLLENGLPAAEITFRTAAAEETIKRAAKEFPELTLGAGTILNTDNLMRARDAGASFAVAPGFNPTVVRAAVDAGFPFVPGVCTPTEIEQAFEAGCSFLKFFPAEASGGVKMLQNFLGPYRQLGLRFMPTGGITPAILDTYLSIPEIVAVGGTWLAKSRDISNAAASGDWSPIATLVAETAAIAAKFTRKD